MVRTHEALSFLAGERAAADAAEGRWFLAALRSAEPAKERERPRGRRARKAGMMLTS
jgi:hypothetical protein